MICEIRLHLAFLGADQSLPMCPREVFSGYVNELQSQLFSGMYSPGVTGVLVSIDHPDSRSLGRYMY